MSEQPAPSSPFALKWRLFGIRFCINPSFWIVNAIWGYVLLKPFSQFARISENFLLYMGLWVLCTLASVLVHELGHVIMGRIFGQPGNVTLGLMGGQATGAYEYLRPWERMLVAAAGPGAGFLFLGLQILLDFTLWNQLMGELDWNFKVHWFLIDSIVPLLRHNGFYRDIMFFLFLMNLFWNIINLVPIIPMDGGIIFREICIMLAPEGGLKFAHGSSFILAGTVALYHLVILLQRYNILRGIPIQLPAIYFPELAVIIFGMMAYMNFQALRQFSTIQRKSQYADPFDD